MKGKLAQYGEDIALVLDRPLRDQLHLEVDTPVYVSSDGRVLIVSIVEDEVSDSEFNAALERLHERYSHALKRRAE